MRKILLYFSLIAVNFAFASEIEISLLEYKSNSFVYNIPAVLDEESKINLPFLIYSLGKDIESVSVDSFFFSEGIIAGDFDVKIFSGNVPLSMPSVSKSDSRPDNVSAGIISDEGVKTLKIFPFTYDGRTLKYHKSLKLFYTADYMRSDDPKAEPEYDCLIVCHADYDTAFERLKKWKEQRGLKTRIITTDSIFAYYSGADSAEKLRNFIKSEHALFDFTYLILGGDRATIPVRRMYAMNCNADYYDDEDSIPADIYYSALEGDFDFDNDGIYGEISDSADLTQEILVGRILFDTIYYGPSPIITRIIDYEQTKNTEQLNRGMFMGMILWNPPFTPGGEAKEMIYNDIIPTSFHVLKFYEHWGHSGKADILDSLDNGYGIVNHNGHGSFKGIWVDTLTSLSRGDMTGLTNFSKTGLFYSIGCWVGAFDRDNTTYNLHSITQNMQNSPTGGYISIITNSRYGWGAPGYPGLGVSDVFDYRFFDMLFNSEEKRPAALLRDLKEEFSPLSDNENLYRWHQYQLNYFGDPSTMIYTGNPEVLNVSIKKSDSTLLISILKSNGFPAEKADVCIYRDSIIERGVTDAGGYFSADIGSFADSTVIITVTGAMLSTFIDTVDLGHAMESEIIISSDSIHSGAQNSIRLINPSFTAIDVDLLSDFIDTSISISAGETIYVDYAPVYSASRTDTITWTIAGGGASGEVVVNVKPTLLKFDSLYFESTVFNAKLLFNHTKMLKDCIVRIVLSGTDTLLDTAISGSFIGEAKKIE
ncbi:MAG: C25 family cysteine peptidase, partial [bacterium]|nr:C25 family cysteine peptidase [bacterium]